MEVAERLESLDTLRGALGELDRAPGEAIALLDGEAPVRVGRAYEEIAREPSQRSESSARSENAAS